LKKLNLPVIKAFINIWCTMLWSSTGEHSYAVQGSVATEA